MTSQNQTSIEDIMHFSTQATDYVLKERTTVQADHPITDYAENWCQNCSANTTSIIEVTTNETSSHGRLLDNVGIPLSFTLFLIMSLGILLNGVTLFMFYRNKLSKSGSNQLLLNLTCCDLLVCCTSFPFLLLALLWDSFPLGETGCRVYLYMFLLLGNVSNNCMTAIAVDR